MTTKKHETTSQVTGSYVDFQAAVLRALPRDINPDVALNWTQNGKLLARILRKVLMSYGKPAGKTYPLSVNYERSVEDGVKAGRYDWVSFNITSRNFPTKRKGTEKVALELINFNRSVSTDEALHELYRMGYRPAELRELLAFGEKYPEVQREFLVVALGSVWQNQNGYRHVPYLGRNGSRRHLGLNWLGDDWNEICRFAAVRK